jgi:hypothetical protein
LSKLKCMVSLFLLLLLLSVYIPDLLGHCYYYD